MDAEMMESRKEECAKLDRVLKQILAVSGDFEGVTADLIRAARKKGGLEVTVPADSAFDPRLAALMESKQLANHLQERAASLTFVDLTLLISLTEEDPAAQQLLFRTLRFHGERIAANSSMPLAEIIDWIDAQRERIARCVELGNGWAAPLRESTAAVIALCPEGTEFDHLAKTNNYMDFIGAHNLREVELSMFFACFNDPDAVRRFLKIESPASFVLLPDSTTTEGYPVEGGPRIDTAVFCTLIERMTGTESLWTKACRSELRHWGCPDTLEGVTLRLDLRKAETALSWAHSGWYEDYRPQQILKPYREYLSYHAEQTHYDLSELAQRSSSDLAELNSFGLAHAWQTLKERLRALRTADAAALDQARVTALESVEQRLDKPVVVLHVTDPVERSVEKCLMELQRRRGSEQVGFLVDSEEVSGVCALLGHAKPPGISWSALEALLLNSWREEIADALYNVGARDEGFPIYAGAIVPVYPSQLAKAHFKGYEFNGSFDGIVIPQQGWERRGDVYAAYLRSGQSFDWLIRSRGLLRIPARNG